MPKKKRKRRKMQNVPGSNFTMSEHDVARTLKETYEIERKNHVANQRTGSDQAHRMQIVSVDRAWTEEAKDENVEAFEGETDKEFWLGLARKVLARRFDPSMFIRRQFMVLNRALRPPPKKKLTGAKAFSNYEAGKEASRGQISTALTIQRDTARTEIILGQDADCDVVEAAVEVLWDMELSLSPLFRYCLALQLLKEHRDNQFQEVADAFHTVAALQYMEDPEAYDTVWGSKWLPTGFRSEAALAYSKVYGV
jgi:hypothetical protein